MRALIQRTSSAHVEIDGKIIGKIRKGIVILLGITHDDTEKDIDCLVEKIINLRIFPSEKSEFDISILDIKGELLVVSQFTLYSDTKKGRRPDFALAAKPEIAQNLYQIFIEHLKLKNLSVATGQFGALMKVHLVNDGPVTIILDSKK